MIIIPNNMSVNVGQFLPNLQGVDRYLEIGTCYGDTTLKVLNAFPDVEVTTVNPLAKDTFGRLNTIKLEKDKIGRSYKEAGLSNRVRQIYKRSSLLTAKDAPLDYYDVVFIDGQHTYEVVLNDSYFALTRIRNGGIIVWHDTIDSLEELIASGVEENSTQNSIVEVTQAIHDCGLLATFVGGYYAYFIRTD